MVEKAAPEPQFESLLRYIQESRGLDFRGYKRTSLRRRITLRMEAVGADDFGAYQSHLEVHPGEFEDLLNTVLINVTSFYRDPEAWEVLRTEVVPQVIAAAAQDNRAIRIWSVGCASGEEPYSIAMLFAEALGIADFCARVKIYATDLDEEALRSARQATYSSREVEGVPPDQLQRYFERTNHHYVFNREVRKCVIFGRHNVVRDAPISRIDLLVCRNLLIYLEAETQDIVLPRLHYALAPEGFLFLGKAETQLARSALFRPVEMKHRIFAKLPQEWRRTNGGGLVLNRDLRDEVPVSHGRLLEAVLNEAGAAYLVVDETGVVTLANQAARSLLSVGEADIGRLFRDLPISYRPLELRGPIDEAMRERRVIRLEHQEFHQSQTEIIRLTIEIRPLFRNQTGSAYAAVLSFTNTTQLYALQRELETAQESLEQSIEELQSANEELETTNEELQSTNEELETTNEELQSTNEELETINEEARSSNEEMESANEELRIQAQQAVNYKTYLESVLRSMNIGVAVIDQNHIVQSWNRWSENAWGLRAEEVVGTSLDTLDIGFPIHLLRDGLMAVQSGREQVAEQTVEGVDRRGRPILCRVRLSPLAADDSTAGVVIAFEDITEERRREEYTRYLGRIIGRALNEVYFLNPDTLHFALANHGAEVKLGCTSAQLTQMTLADVMPNSNIEELKQLFAPLIDGEKPEIVFETTISGMTGRDYPAEVCMQYFGDEVPRILVAIVHDISERQRLAAA